MVCFSNLGEHSAQAMLISFTCPRYDVTAYFSGKYIFSILSVSTFKSMFMEHCNVMVGIYVYPILCLITRYPICLLKPLLGESANKAIFAVIDCSKHKFREP